VYILICNDVRVYIIY